MERLIAVVCAAAVLLGGCAAADAGAVRGIDYTPADGVERLGSAPLSTDDVGLLYAFDAQGDTLYLLDRTGRVLIVEKQDTTWQLVRSFGRRGYGPGELSRPTGIAVNDSAIAVIDGVRLQFFSHAGEVSASRHMELPCPMSLPGVAFGERGIFVHGNCVRGAFVTDTFKSVLVWTRDLSDWQTIAEELRFTSDGSAGNIFAASSALTPHAGAEHLFGTGATNCVWFIADGDPPTARRECAVIERPYRADAPPELQEKLRTVSLGRGGLRWPETLPSYVERIRLASGRLVLLRPFSPDSLVVQLAAPDSRDIAVGSANSLVGCTAGGCLWAEQSESGVRLTYLDTASMSRRIR